MLKHFTNSWTMFCGTIVGIFLLMVSIRPELQAREGEEGGPAKKVAVAGHVLTWSTSSVLAYRMVRTIRKHGISEEVRIHTPPAGPSSQGGKPPTES
jgi:uncharacterized membrane protein